MKVKELIEQLSNYPQDIDVRLEILTVCGSCHQPTQGDIVRLEYEDNSKFGDGLQFVYIVGSEE